MDATSRHHDSYAEFHFIIKFDDDMKAGFPEVNGLPTEGDVEDRTKGEGTTVRKLPGERKYVNLSLKRGFTSSRDLWEWRKSATGGQTRRLSGTISVFDGAGRPASTWKFDKAWPKKWEGPAFNGKTSDVAIEGLEIVVEGLSLISPSDDPKP